MCLIYKDDFIIRPMIITDAANAALIHMNAFRGFFLSMLGYRFLIQLYKSFAGSGDCIALVAFNARSNEMVGFAVGPVNPSRYFRRLLIEKWWAFVLSGIIAVCKDLRITTRLFRAIVYRGDMQGNKKRALLSSIAVSPGYKGSGLGDLLLKKWIEVARTKQVVGCYLTTDADDNLRVIRFYEKNGWTRAAEYTTQEGRRMYRYLYDFQ